jgi:putative flippase GtrA
MVGSLLLYQWCTGAISRYNNGEDGAVNVPGAKLAWAPFYISGIWNTAVNTYTMIYMVIVMLFSFWPSQMSVEKTTIDFSVVGNVGTIVLALLYYVLRARKMYTGSVMEFSV